MTGGTRSDVMPATVPTALFPALSTAPAVATVSAPQPLTSVSAGQVRTPDVASEQVQCTRFWCPSPGCGATTAPVIVGSTVSRFTSCVHAYDVSAGATRGCCPEMWFTPSSSGAAPGQLATTVVSQVKPTVGTDVCQPSR